MIRPRDSQRQRLYNAERWTTAFKDPERRYETVAEAQRFVNDVLALRWVQARWGQRSIEVRPGHGCRKAIAYGSLIQLPVWARQQVVILHEVAHCLTAERYAWHGPEFAGVFVALLERAIDADAAREMRDAYRIHRVRWSNRAIPAPRSSRVVTKKAQADAERSRRERPATTREMAAAAETIRRAARMGIFGEAGRKPRVHALATARILEGMSS